MAPTWPQQPVAAEQPPPLVMQAPPPLVAAAAPKSHRGLWIGLGALIAVAVIVVAALQLPRFLGTEASAPASSEQAAQPAQEPARQAAAPEAAPPPAAEQAAPVEPAASAPATPAQAAAIEKAEPRRQVSAPAARQRSAAAVAEAPATPPPAPAESTATNAPAVPSQPAQPPVDPAVMAELRERMRLLAARNSAAGRTLKTMEAKLQASGLGLRGDISAAWDRASDSLEEARVAMKDGDAAAIRRALESAERDVDRLDKFLGR
jgi:hypothetical protein